MESNANLHTYADNLVLATRRGFLATAALASASIFSMRAWGHAKIRRAWIIPQKLIQDGAIGKVRYISAIVPYETVISTHFAALSILAPSRAIKTEESRHAATGALSVRSETEGGAQIAIAGASEETRQRVTIEGSEGRIHIVDGVVSVQSRGEWREFVV